MKVSSHKGIIVVLLPRTLCGDVLPALASSMRSMEGKSGKITLQIGDSVRARVPEPCASEVDHCQLSTLSGKVVLGFSGEDAMPELVKERNMWQVQFCVDRNWRHT
ncbi:hypothetical protein BDN67DRAFT_961996 [Paxillus ammoniavirescens]|nr:hypothetical protein BDN67DRAFT_961996 [Paxillus ammoniavirescens]